MTVGAQGFFTDETPDSDVAQLLAPHATALITHVRSDDSRILDLVRAGAGVADEAGVDDMGWPELYAALDDSSMALTARLAEPSGRRDDYALAAGADAGPAGGRQRRQCPARRWPRHTFPGRQPAAADDGIGPLGPRLDCDVGSHRRRRDRDARNAGAGPSLGAGTVGPAGDDALLAEILASESAY